MNLSVLATYDCNYVSNKVEMPRAKCSCATKILMTIIATIIIVIVIIVVTDMV